MYKLVCSVLAVICLLSTQAYASRSSYNPMTPRSQWVEEQDHTYGFSILAGNSIDSLEGLNRTFFFVNYNILDNYILRPVAVGYSYLPSFVQQGTGNFFSNIDDLNGFINNLLVLNFKDSSLSLLRFLINSTIGIAGFIDVASALDIDKHQLSFSSALGIMGMDNGAYINLPFSAPNTARSIQGNLVDDAPFLFFPNITGLALFAIEGIHKRAQLLDKDDLIKNALDPYAQMRDTYLMYEEGLVKKAQGIDATDVSNEEMVDESLLEDLE